MGVGAAASEPGTLSMIRQLYPDRAARARSLGIWAAVSSLGLALGPLIGSLLVYGWSWRAIFWFNVFFGALALLSAAFVLPESSDPVGARFDFAGFVLAAVALGSLTFAIILGETHGYRTWWIALLFGFSLLAAIAASSSRNSRPRTRSSTFATFEKPAFTGSNIIAFTAYFGTFAIFFMVALYLQVVGAESPLGLALDFVPMAVGMVAASLFTGRWVAAWGPRIPMATGCFLAGAGILLTNRVISPTVGYRADRMDHVHRRSWRRHGHGAGDLGRTRFGTSPSIRAWPPPPPIPSASSGRWSAWPSSDPSSTGSSPSNWSGD